MEDYTHNTTNTTTTTSTTITTTAITILLLLVQVLFNRPTILNNSGRVGIATAKFTQ